MRVMVSERCPFGPKVKSTIGFVAVDPRFAFDLPGGEPLFELGLGGFGGFGDIADISDIAIEVTGGWDESFERGEVARFGGGKDGGQGFLRGGLVGESASSLTSNMTRARPFAADDDVHPVETWREGRFVHDLIEFKGVPLPDHDEFWLHARGRDSLWN